MPLTAKTNLAFLFSRRHQPINHLESRGGIWRGVRRVSRIVILILTFRQRGKERVRVHLSLYSVHPPNKEKSPQNVATFLSGLGSHKDDPDDPCVPKSLGAETDGYSKEH